MYWQVENVLDVTAVAMDRKLNPIEHGILNSVPEERAESARGSYMCVYVCIIYGTFCLLVLWKQTILTYHL